MRKFRYKSTERNTEFFAHLYEFWLELDGDYYSCPLTKEDGSKACLVLINGDHVAANLALEIGWPAAKKDMIERRAVEESMTPEERNKKLNDILEKEMYPLGRR